MNILISITHLMVGGPAMFVIRLSQALSKNNKVFVYDLYPLNSEKSYYKLFVPEVKLITFPSYFLTDFIIWKINGAFLKMGFKFSFWEVLRNLHLRWIIFYYDIDVVNSHYISSDRILVNMLKDSNIPVVASMHGCYDDLDVQQSADEVINSFRNVLNGLSGIIYVSRKNIRLLSELQIDTTNLKVEQIYYGYLNYRQSGNDTDFRKKLKINPSDFIFGMVARGDESKGWKEAIMAFEQLEHPPDKQIHLVLVCDNTEHIRRLSKSYQKNPNIHFTGFVPTPADMIMYFDVALLPTYFFRENCPNSVIEYLSCNKPVIATAFAEIPNMLKAGDKTAGQLISLDSDGKANIKELKFAMQLYLNNSSIYNEHKLLAEKAFEKFNMDTCVESYMNVFHKVRMK